MPLDVRFDPHAERDLDAIGEFIAKDSPANAVRFLDRVEEFCQNLAEFPEKGRARPDIAPGIRSYSFERRVLLAYRVEDDHLVILRILYAGQRYEDTPD